MTRVLFILTFIIHLFVSPLLNAETLEHVAGHHQSVHSHDHSHDDHHHDSHEVSSEYHDGIGFSQSDHRHSLIEQSALTGHSSVDFKVPLIVFLYLIAFCLILLRSRSISNFLFFVSYSPPPNRYRNLPLLN